MPLNRHELSQKYPHLFGPAQRRGPPPPSPAPAPRPTPPAPKRLTPQQAQQLAEFRLECANRQVEATEERNARQRAAIIAFAPVISRLADNEGYRPILAAWALNSALGG
jgi:hypothetical protein